jgi:hypothetical protein
MAPKLLRSFLEGARERVLWIEYDAYAHRVFANSASDWLTQATRYANTVVQARKALKTDVLTVDIAAAGLAAVTTGSPVERCKAVLADSTARRYISECIDAVLHKLGDDVDLVLRVPAPGDLLRACGSEDEPEFDALDDVGTAMVAALRAYSDKAIAGLLLTRAATMPLSADEIDAYGPVLNAAHHYGWVTCMAVSPALLMANSAKIEDVDLVLCADLPVAQLPLGGRGVGGGLGSALWAVTGGMPVPPAGKVLFGTIPAAANPETVLANCAALAG